MIYIYIRISNFNLFNLFEKKFIIEKVTKWFIYQSMSGK